MASIISAGTTSGTSLNLSGDTSGVLQLASNGSTTAVTISTAQNVGIGTSSPAYKLEVAGTLGVESTGNNVVAGLATLFEESANRTRRNRLEIGGDASGQFINATWSSGGTTAMRFQTDGTERMRITSGGYVIVSGTSTSSDDATYQGGGEFVSRRASSAGTLHAAFINGGTQVGSITSNTTTTFYNTSSDYRLKENVTPMVGALNKVAQLKPCTYTWKLNGSAGQGFIAHELKEVVPDAVAGEKDAVNAEGNPIYQGVDTSYLVATLTAAIQELKAEVDSVKAEVQALKGVA